MLYTMNIEKNIIDKFTEYAKKSGENESIIIEKLIIEYLEDKEDLKAIEEAIKNDDGVYYTHEEIKRELGL